MRRSTEQREVWQKEAEAWLRCFAVDVAESSSETWCCWVKIQFPHQEEGQLSEERDGSQSETKIHPMQGQTQKERRRVHDDSSTTRKAKAESQLVMQKKKKWRMNWKEAKTRTDYSKTKTKKMMRMVMILMRNERD